MAKPRRARVWMIIVSFAIGVALLPLAFYLAFSGDWGGPEWWQYVAMSLSAGLFLQRWIGSWPSVLVSIVVNALLVYLVLSFLMWFVRACRDRR